MKNSVVVFQDEVHFMAQTTVTRAWAPVGSAPKIKSLHQDGTKYRSVVLLFPKPVSFLWINLIASTMKP